MTAPPGLASTDEFDWIARLRPLTRGDPRAIDLADDAAVLPPRPGCDTVISQDAMVEGVHFLAGEAPRFVARRLLGAALSDLAAKAADPFGWLMMSAFPAECDAAWREAFAAALAEEGERYALPLLGGDTVATPGALVLCATVLGWAPTGGAITRMGARAGDALAVCGTIGDGWLGLKAARGEIPDPDETLAARYRAPRPLFCLRDALRAHVAAAVDVSDGLMADAMHVAEAGGLGLRLNLDDLPLSEEARVWRDAQPDPAAAILSLAAGGDDYALAVAVRPASVGSFLFECRATGVAAETVGAFSSEPGLSVSFGGRALAVERLGWRH